MSDTVIDFGGFTVDVSKIQWMDKAGMIPDTFVRVGATGLWLGPTVAEILKDAYEKHRAKVARENLADGWYWASTARHRRLIRIKDSHVQAHWHPQAKPAHVNDCQWSDYQTADPMSAEFMEAIKRTDSGLYD